MTLKGVKSFKVTGTLFLDNKEPNLVTQDNIVSGYGRIENPPCSSIYFGK
jgi:hypothetical protein